MSRRRHALDDVSIPRLRRGVRLKHDTVREKWTLLGPERIFELDPIAVEIVKRIDGKRDLSAIVDELADIYSAGRDQIMADVQEFLGQLAERRAIETSPPSRVS